MSTISKKDSLTLAGERAFQENYERFKKETFELACKQQTKKQRQDKEGEKPVESVDADK